MNTALLLVAHGSRNQAANEDLYFIADHMRKLGRYSIVEPSFLDLAEPTIPQGGDRCVEQGAEHVIILPYFLSPGVHARDDLEEHRRKFVDKYPGTRFVLAEPLGRHPLLVELVALRAREADERHKD